MSHIFFEPKMSEIKFIILPLTTASSIFPTTQNDLPQLHNPNPPSLLLSLHLEPLLGEGDLLVLFLPDWLLLWTPLPRLVSSL